MGAIINVFSATGGGGSPTFRLDAASYDLTGTGQTASFELATNGQFLATTSSSTRVFQYNWLTGGTSSDYKVEWALISGSYSANPATNPFTISTAAIFTRIGPTTAQTVQAVVTIKKVSDSSTVAGPVTITLLAGP